MLTRRLCYSAFFVLTGSISKDLDIIFEQQSWVITSYSVTFAAFLLFFGRVSDLYSPRPVFVYGFTGLGLLSLVISFLPEKYSFFVLRALSGIFGACLIPSSYRLIVYVFETKELELAFTLYGVSGAIANVAGIVVAGFVAYIPQGGQMQDWRWFFRILAIIILPAALLSFKLVPHVVGMQYECPEGDTKLKRLDLVGSLLMLAGIVLIILGLTLGASYGWKKPGFIVPFILGVLLFPTFFVWEGQLSPSTALLPNSTWRIPNFALWILFATPIYAWWGVNFLALVEIFVSVHHERALLAAARVLPQGISAFLVVMVLSAFPTLVSRPRWTVAIGSALGTVAYALMSRPHTFVGTEYWRWLFPAFIIGSGGNAACFTAANVMIMVSVPPEMSAVAGATLQVAFQMGAAIGFAVQAGLLSVNPGGLANRENVQASFYFQMGWNALWLVVFLAFYRTPKLPNRPDIEQPEEETHQD